MNKEYKIGDIVSVDDINDLNKFLNKYEATWIKIGYVKITGIKE